MDDSTESNTPRVPERVPEDEARRVFDTMRIGTKEQRTLIVEQGRKATQVKPARSYSLRLSYSSGHAMDNK